MPLFPREQMSKDEFTSLLDEELADPQTTEERRADLTGPVEEVAARTGVDLVEQTTPDEQNQTIPEDVPVQVPPVPTEATAPALTEPVVSNTETAPTPEAQAQAPVNQEAVAKVVEEHKDVLTPETHQAVALGQQKTKLVSHLGNMEVTISSKVDGSEDTVEYSHKASDAISASKNEKSAYDMLLDCLGRKKKH